MTDILHMIEAMYDIESDDQTWLSQLANITEKVLGRGRGVIANAYDVSSPDAVRIVAAASGVQRGFLDFFNRTSGQLDRNYVQQAYLSSTSCALTSDFAGWMHLPFVQSGELREWSVVDDLVLRGWEPGGHGITLNVFQPTPARLLGRQRAHLARVASHLGTAFRLRRRIHSLAERGASLSDAEAVLDAGGTVYHAINAANVPAARLRLRLAVAEMERARGSLRTREPECALERWKALAAGRWSLVDEFSEGSRRYIVAYANGVTAHGPENLTERERQVVICAAAGHWTKLIAYHLGISDSTVRVLLARAKAKLGARSREELIRIAKTWPVTITS